MAAWPFTRRGRASAPMGERAEAHIRRRLAARPALRGFGPVQACEEIVEGNNSELWRVDLAGGRLIARFWRAEPHRNRAHEHAESLDLVASLGLPAPRLLDVDATPQTERESGFHVTAETWLEGRAVGPGDLREEAVRRQMVDQLLRLHGHAGEVAGRPWSRANREHPWDRWMSRRIGVLLERARQLGRLDRASAERAARALAARQPPLAEVMPFHLSLGDVQPKNYLLAPDGQLQIVDVGALGFAPFELELVTGEASFDMAEEGAFRPVLEDYLAAAPERRARWEQRLDYFRAFDFLRRAVSAQRKTLKARHAARREEFAARGERFWERFAALLERLG